MLRIMMGGAKDVGTTDKEPQNVRELIDQTGAQATVVMAGLSGALGKIVVVYDNQVFD
jgi:hypothetical protein